MRPGFPLLRDLRTPATKLLGALVRSAYPDHCVFCGTPVAGGQFCGACNTSLPRIGDACPRCATALPATLPGNLPCGACQLRPPPFSGARAALHYAYPVDAALKALKFHRQLHYVPAFVTVLEPLLGQALPGVDAIVPVPLHRWRHATRGFNQAYELAKPLARRFALPLVTAARRTRRTRPQTGLNAPERRRNLEGAFVVSGRLGCRHPLIVDDVMTTGETCRQLADALLCAGVAEVSVLTVARASAAGTRIARDG